MPTMNTVITILVLAPSILAILLGATMIIADAIEMLCDWIDHR